jgi:hypothetical protein
VATAGLFATEYADPWWARIVHGLCSLVAFPAMMATLFLFLSAAHIIKDDSPSVEPASSSQQAEPDCDDHGLPSLC